MVKTFTCNVRSQSHIQIGFEFDFFFDTFMFLFDLEIFHLQINILWESPCEIDNSPYRSLMQTFQSCNPPGLDDLGIITAWIL